tara:strand:- start:36061 stop:36594 length:534 start_codon:yes stop_codon:yes gene_type:complete
MTENKVEIPNLVSEDHELITTKLDNFDFDKDDAEKLEDTLINCMDFYRGYGISANQIGINARVFAMIHEEQPMVMFNPKVVSVTDEKLLAKEGCLTWYGLYPKVSRPQGVTVNYQDKEGQPFAGSFIDLSARIILHEYDHLNGYTFFDRAKQMHMQQAKKRRKIYIRKAKRQAKEMR